LVKSKPLLFLFLLLNLSSIVWGQEFRNSTSLPDHPRLLLQKGKLEEIKENVQSSSSWKALNDLILKEAEQMLRIPTTPIYRQGKTMLIQAREVFLKVFFLSYAYQITSDKDFAKRGIQELIQVSQLKDWNPLVFLDVAEMTMAAAIGYDWFYDEMKPSERQIIKKAIVEKGIQPSFDSDYNNFLELDNNWNQVCNAAMVFGAISVYEDNPKLAQNTIERAVESSQLPMKKYNPDGVFPEGLMYWIYGTSYYVMMLEALEGVLESGTNKMYSANFLKSGEFYLHMIANSGKVFNWSDALEVQYLNPAIFWIADKSGDESLLWREKRFLENGNYQALKKSRLLPAVILMGSQFLPREIMSPQRLFWKGEGDNSMAVMRSSWNDPDGIYLGFKLGKVAEHHAHMDMGSFVMESDGVRWALDLGMQEYHSLSSNKVDLWDSSQHGERWTVFRHSNLGHNTLALDDSLMDVTGKAKLEKFSDDPDFQFAIGDLTGVFLRKDREIKRGVGIRDKNHVIIRDEISSSPSSLKVTWRMFTSAKIRIKGNEAILTQDGRELRLQVQAPSNVQLRTRTANQSNAYDAKNKGVRLIGFDIEVDKSKPTAIQVLLIPGSSKVRISNSQFSLSEW